VAAHVARAPLSAGLGRSIALVLLGAGLLACADPPLRLDAEATLDTDGLVRVPSRRVGGSYLRPGASLRGYSKLRIVFTGVEYERPPTRARSGPSGTGANYALTPQQQARLERYFHETFERELAASPDFEVAAAPGAGVLDVRGSIVDLVVQVPSDTRTSDRSFVRRAGEMTLILDASDSQTGEVLVRLADRRVISQSGDFHLYGNDSVNQSAAVRKAFARWARLLRERLEELHHLPASPSP
jgi:hypothetical protein